MKKIIYYISLNVCSIIILLPNVLSAQFQIDKNVFSSGGGMISNADFTLNSTIGQPAVESTGNSEYQISFGFWSTNQLIVGVEDGLQLLPDKYDLLQNYPNPFNPATKIKYSLPKAAHVRLEVFNILGESVSLLVDAEKQPGFYTVDFNASSAKGGLSSGIYIYRLNTSDFVSVKKMILMK